MERSGDEVGRRKEAFGEDDVIVIILLLTQDFR